MTLTSMDIKQFVVKKINENFKERVIKSEITETFPESCFFVYLDRQEMYSLNISQNRKIYPVIVHYKNKDNMRLQEVNEKLEEIFDYCHFIKDTRVLINGFESDVFTDDLMCNFDISFIVNKKIRKDEREKIKELKINTGIGEIDG